MCATPLQGEPGNAVVMHFNITQRKHLERLASANQEMSDFLSLVTHEVRTPLTSLSGYGQLAQRHLQLLLRAVASTDHPAPNVESSASSLRDDLEQVIAQSRRLNRLITDLAEVAQIQAGKLTLQKSLVDLSRIVRETVQEQQQTRPGRTLQLTLPGQAVPIQADAGRIRLVLTNYLINAFKYAPADRPIAVSLSVEASQARVEVCDQGPGLRLEEQKHIWERWYRVPSVRAQEGPGVSLGLGLFIARRIVTLHGGRTGVVSAPGAGATFWFMLPQLAN
jgi:signal transduction histidine kinase